MLLKIGCYDRTDSILQTLLLAKQGTLRIPLINWLTVKKLLLLAQGTRNVPYLIKKHFSYFYPPPKRIQP
jgi:hypothetical protein